MKHNESFWQNSIVFCGQEHLLYRFVGYWCAWVMQILSIRDVWFGRPSWSHRRQQLLRQLLTFSFSAITWLVIFFLLRSCEQCNLWKDRITTIKICLVHNAVLIQRCPKHQNCSQVLNKREKAGGDAPAPTDVASPAKDAGTPAVDVSKEATRLGKWGQGYNLYNGIPNNLSLGMVYYWLWDIHWDQKLQTLVIYCACCRSPMFCHPHSHHLLLKRLGITLSHVKRVQTLCPAGSFGHLLDCGVMWSLFEGPVDPRVKLKGEVCSVKCWVSLEFTDTFTCVSCRQWKLKLSRSETSWTHWPKRSAMSGACTSQDFPGPPCLACLVCLAKLLTVVRSLPFHSHKTWQLHHCWYMIRWDRGCFGGWFTWRQWRQRVFPEVTCMNACSTFPNLQKLPRFLMKRPQNWHRRASQLWNDEQF